MTTIGRHFVRTGRTLKEDDTYVNLADLLEYATDVYGSFKVTAITHAMTHAGVLFSISAKITIAANGSYYFAGTTDGSVIHFNSYSFYSSSGGLEVRLYEDTVFTGGTPVQGVNRNRDSTNTPTFTTVAAPTITNIGTEIDLIAIPEAETGASRVAQATNSGLEWRLESGGVNYALEFDNIVNSEKTVYVQMIWYEPGLLP